MPIIFDCFSSCSAQARFFHENLALFLQCCELWGVQGAERQRLVFSGGVLPIRPWPCFHCTLWTLHCMSGSPLGTLFLIINIDLHFPILLNSDHRSPIWFSLCPLLCGEDYFYPDNLSGTSSSWFFYLTLSFYCAVFLPSDSTWLVIIQEDQRQNPLNVSGNSFLLMVDSQGHLSSCKSRRGTHWMGKGGYGMAYICEILLTTQTGTCLFKAVYLVSMISLGFPYIKPWSLLS